MKISVSKYLSDREGAGTIEFVSISLALLFIVFFIVEMTLMYFFIQAEQKAAHIGARLAVVSDPVVTGLSASNQLVAGQIFGTSCGDAAGPCVDFGQITCTGGGCVSAPFDRILTRMQDFLPAIQAEHVTFSYAYQGLGYAGGPVVPAITVRIDGVPHQTGVLGVLLGAAFGSQLPAVSVTLTGEDLNQDGA